jgi:hypothetical protein
MYVCICISHMLYAACARAVNRRTQTNCLMFLHTRLIHACTCITCVQRLRSSLVRFFCVYMSDICACSCMTGARKNSDRMSFVQKWFRKWHIYARFRCTVSMWMDIYIYIHTHTYIHIYIYTHTRMYIRTASLLYCVP